MVPSGPIVGIRVWLVNRNGLLPLKLGLKGTNSTYIWDPGVNEARCNTYSPATPVWLTKTSKPQHAKDKRVPGEACICGFHAFYSLTDLLRYFEQLHMKYILQAGVIGIVRGWGHTRLHPDGWRTQFAEPIALFHGLHESDGEGYLKQLAEIYSLPLLGPGAYPHIMSEFGIIVPEDLRPDLQS